MLKDVNPRLSERAWGEITFKRQICEASPAGCQLRDHRGTLEGIFNRARIPLPPESPYYDATGLFDEDAYLGDLLRRLEALAQVFGSSDADKSSAALALLDALKQLERSLGRRAGEHWGPREVDLDLLVFGHFEMHVERTPGARSDDLARARRRWLDVPHAAAAERLFVLAPLAELAPHLRPPGWPETVAEARARVAATEADDAVQVVATWDAPGRRWQPAERRR